MKSRKSKSKVGKPKAKATSTVEHIVEKQPQPEGFHFNIELPDGLKVGVHKRKGWYAIWSAVKDKSSKLGVRLIEELATGLRKRDLVNNNIPILNLTLEKRRPPKDIIVFEGRTEPDKGEISLIKKLVGWPKGTAYHATIERIPNPVWR